MKIISIKSHVLRYELEKELGYSQQYYNHRTAHLVEIQTDEGITGWGECFGPGNIALANKNKPADKKTPPKADPNKVYNIPIGDSFTKGPANAAVTLIAVSYTHLTLPTKA